ncbi:MAG: response regulator [Desulforhopalus sp.]
MSNISLLIVEDNPADSLLIKEYLAENRYHTFDFFDAESMNSALGLIDHYDFDAVLLDLQLPDSSGLDTVRQMIARLPDTAVIVLSGLQDEELALQTVRYGVQDYLEKRYLSPTTLNKSIRYSIERKKAIQDKEDLLHDLDLALQRVELLENLLPLCIGCKKIFGEDEQWHTTETYKGSLPVTRESGLICSRCLADLEIEN